MRYKGIVLKEESGAEICCNLLFDDELSPQNKSDLIDFLISFPYDIYYEFPFDDFVLVRCNEITFDKKGVEVLQQIHNKLINHIDAIVEVDILVSYFLFKRNGLEYNNDSVSLEDFLENIEY